MFLLYLCKKNIMSKQHYGDLYRWVEKVINSCQTHEQLKRADRLIYYFSNHETVRELFNNDYKLYTTLTRDLNHVSITKTRELLNSDTLEVESTL